MIISYQFYLIKLLWSVWSNQLCVIRSVSLPLSDQLYLSNSICLTWFAWFNLLNLIWFILIKLIWSTVLGEKKVSKLGSGQGFYRQDRTGWDRSSQDKPVNKGRLGRERSGQVRQRQVRTAQIRSVTSILCWTVPNSGFLTWLNRTTFINLSCNGLNSVWRVPCAF